MPGALIYQRQTIPPDLVQMIRERVRIEDYIGERIELRQVGKTLVGRCPWHQSKSGRSFVVYPEQQSWRCWGCSIGGDIYSFVERYTDASFPAAVKLVAHSSGVDLDGPVHHSTDEQVGWRTHLGEVERRITEILDSEFMRVASEYDSARRQWRRVTFRLDEINSGSPERFRGESELAWLRLADLTESLRRIDVEYMFLGFGRIAEREKFSASAPDERKRQIDALLEEGIIVGDKGRVFEVPEW